MDFLILPHIAAKKLTQQYPGQLNVISVERTEPVDAELCKNHLQLRIDDLKDKHITNVDALKAKGMIFPEMSDILSAIEFDKKCGHKIHIIHCHAGISRSTAIGYAILRSRGDSKEMALRKIMEIAPNALPNSRIVRMTDDLFP